MTHIAIVGRKPIGRTPYGRGGTLYGTTLACKCGKRWGKVSNSAPSNGGRKHAMELFRTHLAKENDDKPE